MKKISIISLLLFSLVFCYCSENNITESPLEKGLNFYLLKDTTLSANKLAEENISISKLKLNDKPFLTYKDLTYYNWSEHSFSIDSIKAREIEKICKKNINVMGLPFIVSVGKDRIYLGAFWFEISSIPSMVPFIEIKLSTEHKSEIMTINKAKASLSSDPRSDDRIYNTLKENGLLLE